MVALAEVMSKEVVTLTPDSTVSDAARVMVRGGFGSVVIVQGRMLLGILTERDVLRAAAEEDDLRAARVDQWMTEDPDTALPDLDSEEAASLMLSRGYRHLPVEADGELLGELLRGERGGGTGLDHASAGDVLEIHWITWIAGAN